MRISHANVTEVLHVFEVFSSFVANKMKCVFVKFTTECLQVKSTWWQFTLKFTIEVYNEYLIYDEVLTQSYIREKLLFIYMTLLSHLHMGWEKIYVVVAADA